MGTVTLLTFHLKRNVSTKLTSNMDCRTIAVALVATLAVLSATSGNVIPNESMQDVVTRLMRTTSELQKKSQDLDSKMMAEKKKNQEAEAKLAAEITKLTSEIGHLKTGKIKQALLPGGYSDYSVEDLQWQSLHMSAAAACRGATFTGGSGPYANFVYPRNAHQSCTEICKSHKMVCDAAVTLNGFMGRAKKETDAVGLFYNYNCGGRGWTTKELDSSVKISTNHSYLGYYCCRTA